MTSHRLRRYASPLLVAGTLLPVRALGGDVTVQRSDGRSVVIEYRPRYSPPQTVTAPDGRQYTIQAFDGAQGGGRSADVGGPDLKYRYLPLAFPGERQNSVRVIAADYEDLRGALLAPVPMVKLENRIPGAPVFRADPGRYGVNSFLPASIASLSSVGRVRDMLLGGVRVYPVQFNPLARTIRKYSRIVLEVTFGPQASFPVQRRGEDRLLAAVPLNYNVARGWARTSVQRSAPPAPSVLATGTWYRLSVIAEGMYRLEASYLAALGIDIAHLDPGTIKIFGNGGKELSSNVTVPRPTDLTELAIEVVASSNSQFGAGDYVVFYGRGARGVTYDPFGKTLRHYINHYTEVNYYWLTTGGAPGKRMVQQGSLASSPTDLPADRFTDEAAIEEERIKYLKSGKDWYGEQILSGASFTYLQALPGLIPNSRVLYRFALVGASDTPPLFTVQEGNNSLGSYQLNAIYGYDVAEEQIFQSAGTSSLPNNSSQLTFSYSGDVSSQGYIDWVEIQYPRLLSGVNDSLHFRAPDTTAVVEYHLQQFSATPSIFNVTSHENVRMITGVGGSFLFRAGETSGAPSEYWAVAGNSWRVPATAAQIPNQNVRGYADGADFIIVTSSEYVNAANRLKTYRQDPSHGGLKTYVADVNLIYNEFGGGVPDVTAIRDFLLYAYNTWTPQPAFVLMLGQGSFDYKGILGQRSSYVPTWQTDLTGYSTNEVDSWCTDDYFAEFAYPNSAGTSLAMGRVNARAPAEADAFVDKLIRYEGASAADSWKMRMLFIADDAWTPEGGEVGDETIHSAAAEELSQPFFTPPEFEEEKIYIAEYPTVWQGQGRTKPGAFQDIISDINRGALVVSYAGHGNTTQLAHENIFNVATSLPQLVNSDRLCVWFLATCNFSQFDDPEAPTGSELLINKPDGASIGVLSATRAVYAGDNAALNQGTYLHLFSRDAFGRVVIERPATALWEYKAGSGDTENDQKYFFMGDPTMRLQFPKGYASIDSINGQVPDSAGTPRSVPVQIRSLARVTVSGTVRDANYRPDPTFRGQVEANLNDATQTRVIVNFYPGLNWPYAAPGGLIYRGENSVQNGHFTATFLVPKDIQYSDSLSRGRLACYLHRDTDPTSDAEAYTGNVHIGGTDTTAVNPRSGPSIGIFLGNRSFRPGDVVGENPTLFVDLADSSGINTSTSGVGHRIEAWINNAAQSVDLTSFYASTLDDYRRGSIQYQLAGVPDGKNSIRVRAWDSFDNSASAESFFVVASTDRLTVSDVFNYPNPFGARGTEFTFRQNQSTPLNVTVKIFTLAGRLIRTLDAFAPGDSFVRLPWDGRDRDGDVIANGVYLYKLIVRTADGRFSSESLNKLSKVE